MANLLTNLLGVSASISGLLPTATPSTPSSGGLNIPVTVPSAIPISDGSDLNSTVIRNIFTPLLGPLANLTNIALNTRSEADALTQAGQSINNGLVGITGNLAPLSNLGSLGSLSALSKIADSLASLDLVNLLNGTTPTDPLLEKLQLLASSGTSNVTKVAPYCTFRSIDGILFNGTNLRVPVGQPLSFEALFPRPGLPLPPLSGNLSDIVQTVNNTVGNQTILPLATLLAPTWVVDYSTDNETWIPAKAASSLQETDAQFQVVKGTLADPITSFVLWPDVSTTKNGTNGLSNTVRYFRFSLNVTSWWPSKPAPLLETVPTRFFVQSESWANTYEALQTQYRNLITFPTSEIRPLPGQTFEVAAAIADLTEQVPEIASSIIKTTPELRVTAGIDFGAIIASAGKLLGSAIGGSGGNAIESGAVTVGGILSSLTSIPIAVAIDGSSITKTLLPSDPVPIGSISKLAGDQGIAGKIPIGSLFTQLRMDASNLVLHSFPSGVKVNSSLLPNGRLGFRFLPLPEFSALGSTQLFTRTSINIGASINITIPGSSIPNTISLPDISIPLVMPRIQIPQVALMSHMTKDVSPRTDALMTIDPDTANYYGSMVDIKPITDQLSTVLNILNVVTSAIGGIDAFNLIDQNMAKQYTGLISVITRMTSRIAACLAAGTEVDFVSLVPAKQSGGHYANLPPTGSQIPEYSDDQLSSLLYVGLFAECGSYDLNVRPKDWWWDGVKRDDHSNNVGSVLWLGAPDRQSGWVLQFQIDDYSDPTDVFELPTAGQSYSGMWNVNSFTTGGGILRSRGGRGDSKAVDQAVFLDNCFQNLRWLQWAKISP